MGKIEKIELRNITKRFFGVLANDNINITFNSSQVHSLLGENGAGKSTLMSVLYGKYPPSEGEIFINGKKTCFKSPLEAISSGIGMVHQHFMLVPSMTVTENIILNYPSPKGLFLDMKWARKKIKGLSEEYSLPVDPDAYIWQLSVGEQQRVEILKVLFRDAVFLILDEPTAVLTPEEVKKLFKILRILLNKDYGIIFISHKLQEVMEISDLITVLRNGKVKGTLRKEDTNKEKLAEMMVGREVKNPRDKEVKAPGEEIILRVKNLSLKNDKNLPALDNLSLDVKKGEILGIAGLSGNGQRELAEAITGLRKVTGGRIFFKDKDITGKDPFFIINSGISFIPEERMIMGVIKDFLIFENTILKNHCIFPLSEWIFMNFKNIRDFSEDLIKKFNIKTPDIETITGNLSGGNIQKLILAREISANPSFLIASQPTRGVDIGAIEYIHKKLLHMREEGVAILLISEDLDEVISLSDRIAVIENGKIMGIVPPSTHREEIGLMMGGVRSEE